MTKGTETIHILARSESGVALGKTLQKDLYRHKERQVKLFSVNGGTDTTQVGSTKEVLEEGFHDADAWIFIGSLGICVRHIAPYLDDKTSDPAVLNIDEEGRFVQSVVSGHRGGANRWAEKLARIIGAEPVISTASEGKGLWALDLLDQRFGWNSEFVGGKEGLEQATVMNRFNEGRSTALLLEVRDEGTERLEKEAPDFVRVYRNFESIPQDEHELLLAVTPFEYDTDLPGFHYRPACFHLGLGCEKAIDAGLFEESLKEQLKEQRISPLSVAGIHSIELKSEEPAFQQLADGWGIPFEAWSAERLEREPVPNPSEEIYETVGAHGVAEAAALAGSGSKELWAEKVRVPVEQREEGQGQRYTLAIGADDRLRTEGEILIVGAGTGDPDLITLQGLEALKSADLILYAGSLIPESLLERTPTRGRLRNSASMELEEQFELMDEAYANNERIVRLHSGDPSIYGAIHEQIKHFEDQGYRYRIVPGIAANQAAAALLKTEFTLPGKVQSIVLTRAPGRTEMPNKESLRRFAETGSTLCIFLSAKMIRNVKAELLEELPPETPAAVCYRLTWPDQQIHRGTLQELDAMVKKNKLTRTVLLVVGEALNLTDERSGLYHPEHHHIFRKRKGKREV